MGVSLLLIAVGLILALAVTADVVGIELETVGWILLGVGALGLLLTLVLWAAGGRGGGGAVREREYR